MVADPSVRPSREPQVRAWRDCLSELVHGVREYAQKESIKGDPQLENLIFIDARKSPSEMYR
jgi:hypothetical protein